MENHASLGPIGLRHIIMITGRQIYVQLRRATSN